MSMMPRLILKAGRERSVLRDHPWVFSGAVAKVEGEAAVGETISVTSAKGDFLGWASYSPSSQIVARIWSREQDIEIGEDFFRRKLLDSIAVRRDLMGEDAVRLVYAEADGLPGFILDRYGDTLVAQYLTAGSEFWRETLARIAMDLTGAMRVYERSDAEVRRLEGLPARSGLQTGAALIEPVEIVENDLKFRIDIEGGHKTGFYLDQRANRKVVRSFARGSVALDCFSYTGGFALNMLAGGAESVVAVDASGAALQLARENAAANNLLDDRIAFVEGDVFQLLRTFRDQDRAFDLIVLDPPKFAPTAAAAEKAARGYKDINLMAMRLLRNGGILVSFSCSGGIDELFFQKILAGAALDAGVQARVLHRLHQDCDHPVALNYPEAAYLKGFVILVQKPQF